MEKKSFSSNLKLGKFRSLLGNLNNNQRDLVKSCGFGSILDFDCSEAPRSVSFWLAKRFDVKTRTVHLQNGSSFVMNPYTVHQILGIPLGGRKIPTRATKQVKDIIGSDTGTSSIAPTVDQLFGLVNNELSGDKFVRVFMLITLAIFLCPTSYGSASAHYYSGIASVKDIPKYDWSSFVLDWLVTSIEKFQDSAAKGHALGKEKTSSLGGCLFVLAVTYFEYIDTPQVLLRDDIPRLKIWDDYMIQEFLALDGNSGDGRSFGLLQLKDVSETPFLVASISSASFSRLPAKVEDFIMRLIPNDEHQNLRDELSDTCRSFYKGMMGSSLAAIQPVIINQMCRMVTTMWDAMSRNMPDRGANNANNLDVPSHILSSRNANDDSRAHVDIGISAHVESETQLPRDTGILQDPGNSSKTSTQRTTTPVVQVGISPDVDNEDSAMKDCSRSPSTIYCGQEFKHRYEESGSNVKNNVSNRIMDVCEDSLQNKASTLQFTPSINSGTPVINVGSDSTPYTGTRIEDSLMVDQSTVGRTATQEPIAMAELNPSGNVDQKDEEDVRDCVHVKGTTDTTKLLTDDIGSANIGPKKKRRITSTSKHSAILIEDVSDASTSHSSSGADMEQETSSSAESDGSAESDESAKCDESDNVKEDDVPAILSDKFTRRRALKLPKSLSSPSIALGMPRKKVVVSKFESQLYNLTTRRLGDKVKSKIIAQIGRFHIDHRLFGDSLRPRTLVGTFLMNVFCEACNADYLADPNLKPSKCFITSYAVDKLKAKEANVSEAAKQLSNRTIGFCINDFNMVMIPVCHNKHWWLIVANLRDHRFDCCKPQG